MRARRFVFDGEAVVEVGVSKSGVDPRVQYAEDRKAYNHQQNTEASPEAGQRFREQTLARAERREWAHKRFGSERRWAE